MAARRSGRGQRQFSEPATRREQARVHPLARLDAGPVAGRFDDSGDLLTRDERQGKPREAAAEEPDVPQADARAMDSDQCLSRRGCWSWPFTQLHAIDPAQLLRQRYAHGSALLTLCSCGPSVPVRARHRLGFCPPMPRRQRRSRHLTELRAGQRPALLSEADPLPLPSGVPEGGDDDELVAVPLGGPAELDVECLEKEPQGAVRPVMHVASSC